VEDSSVWNAVGAIGQIVGALAVVVSLVYLAIQIRQSTRVMMAESARAAVAAVRDFNKSMIEDPSVAKIFRMGAENLSNLTIDERAQFAHVALNFFKTAEDLHYQYVRGTLDNDVWESWRTIVAVYATSPGFREYWSSRSAFFTPAFRAECESWRPPSVVRVDRFAREVSSDSEASEGR
jgi:hypothetical protein